MTAKPRRAREGQTPVLKPLALPQKEGLRDNPMLYESLEAITEYINSVVLAAAKGGVTIIKGGVGFPDYQIVADLADADRTVTLPAPTSLLDPKQAVAVKIINGGVHTCTIMPGVAGLIDGKTTPITTSTNNQGYRFRLATSADAFVPSTIAPIGWVCTQTCFGGDEVDFEPPIIPPPETLDCTNVVPDGVTTDVQEFSSSGTWIKPVNKTWGIVTCIGGGGGGGGGGAGGIGLGAPGGGGGGGAGSKITRAVLLEDLPSSVSVSIGAGGAGGVASGYQAVTSVPGGDGGTTEFGSSGDAWYTPAYGGGGGYGGVANGNGGGGGGGGGSGTGSNTGTGGAPAHASGTNATGTQGGNAATITDTNNAECGGAGGGSGDEFGGSAKYGAGAGGGGGNGGVDFVIVPTAGKAGGVSGAYTQGGGGAGGFVGFLPGYVAHFDAGPGADGPAGTGGNAGGGGGGGGGSDGSSNPGGGYCKAGDGGNGGFPGGGGGGGGGNHASGGSNGAAGKGGDGANGYIRVECW